jgi:hypothetical protein
VAPTESPIDGPTSATATATTTRFYAIGDVPYTPLEAEELAEQMQSLAEDAEFVIHVGDIRSAREGLSCTAEEYVAVADILLQSHAPVFLVMGGTYRLTDRLSAYY